MNFPVANKSTAILKSSYIFFSLLIISTLLYSYKPSINIIYITLAILLLTAILFAFYIGKQNIQRLELHQNELLVCYKKKKIGIPLSEIKGISFGLNYGIDLKFNMTKTYFILLKSKYKFGNKLLVDCKIINNTLDEDPLLIKVLKLEIQRLQNKENNEL